MERQWGGRSASGATPPLPQEPVGPNLAFALEGKNKKEVGMGSGTPTFPNQMRGLEMGVASAAGEGYPIPGPKG